MSAKPGLSGEWVRLGDVVEIEKAPRPCGSEVWLLNLDAIEKDTGKVIEKIRISSDSVGASTVAFTENAILYSKLRPNLNKVVVADEPGLATSEMLPLIAKPEALDRHYLAYFLRSKAFVSLAVSSTAGSKMPRMNKKVLFDAVFRLPDLETQRARAKLLAHIEKEREKSELLIAKLDALVKSKFVEMFERGQRWELRALAECCTTPDDIKCGPFGSQLHKEDYISEGVPVWGIPEVSTNFKRMPDKYVSLENGQRLQSYSLVPGDVAMNRKGNVGQAALFDGKKPSGIIHSDVLRVRVNQDILRPAFLVEQFHSSHVVREQIMSASTGAIMAGTNVTKLKKIKVFVPPLALQQEFADFVTQADKSRSISQQQIEKLQTLYDSLAQEYFS